MAVRFDNAGFKATANHLSDSVLITDPQGRITWSNRAFKKLCGYNLNEVIGRHPGTLLQGQGTDPHTIEAMQHALQQGQNFRAEVLNYHKKGYAYWSDISVTPILDDDGELQGHIGIAHDITPRRMEISQMEHDVVKMYTTLLYQLTDSSKKTEEDPFLSKSHFSEEFSVLELEREEAHQMSH